MKVEEKLLRLSLQIDSHPDSLAGEIETLAREAIALLRELDEYDLMHKRTCNLMVRGSSCTCGLSDYQHRHGRFLDGEGGDGTA